MIYIITPCSRPFNLEQMKKSIPKECTWVISFDKRVIDKPFVEDAICLNSPYTGNYGNLNRNFALEYLKDKINDDDWIYVLDDDNIIHEEWYDNIKDKLSYHSMVQWGQCFSNKAHRSFSPEKPIKGTIDTAQYMVRWGAVKHVRFDDYDYEADGKYAEDCFNAIGSSLRIQQDLCYFNYLRSNKYSAHNATRVRLCMITMFKDELNIGRMLESVTPFIDYWVIQDNGSTDDSAKIIEEWSKKYKIPGKLYKPEQGWVNYSWNQDFLLQTALKEQHCCDWIINMDCNEILEVENDFPWYYFWQPFQSFEVPVFFENVFIRRAWIWNAKLPWKFEHEPTNYSIKLDDGVHGENFQREILPLSFRMRSIS